MNSVPVTVQGNPVQQVIARLGGPRRARLVALGVVMVVGILGLSQWAAAPTWVPLYTGLPLETTGSITEGLTEAGIRYRLELGGSEVRVASTDLARARVVLASSGLPAGGRPGLELFDQPSWGMTDFTQRVNYRRALEGELERTISEMRGVASAKVHLAIPESSSIRRLDQSAEASVVLQLGAGQSPPADVVQGISHLVASSVNGLRSENVTVVDGTGRLLSPPDEPGSAAALNSRQLAIQREIESYLESKAEEIVTNVVGPGNARIQVSASMNFDRLERTVEAVDPDRQALTTEQRSEIIPGAEGGAGSTNQSATYANSRSVEVFQGATGTVQRLTVAVVVNDREIVDGETTRFEARSEAELARIEALVRGAVGVDDSRGDAISVANVAFRGIGPVEEPAEGIQILAVVEQVQRPVVAILGLLLAFVVALKLIGSIRAIPVGPGLLPSAGGGGAGALAASSGFGGNPADPQVMDPGSGEALGNGGSARDRATAQMIDQPDIAARLMRSWLKEG